MAETCFMGYALVLVFGLLLRFFCCFFCSDCRGLVRILSPGSRRETSITTVGDIICSLTPAVMGLVAPVVTRGIFRAGSASVHICELLCPVVNVNNVLLYVLICGGARRGVIRTEARMVRVGFSSTLERITNGGCF